MLIEVLESDYYYHIYNRGNNKEDIFIEEKNYNYFLKLYDKYIEKVADTFAYCLLKNHFHFLIKIKDDDELAQDYVLGKKKISQPFSNLFNAYAKSINKAYGRTGSLFQDRFSRKKVTNEKYLKHLIHYIHANPQKHGFEKDFRKYPHSSYSSYLSDEKTKLKREEGLEFFGSLDDFIDFHIYNKLKYEGIIEKIDEEDD